MATGPTVAQIILSQLGGRRFSAMTGARNFIATNNSLMFQIPQNHKKIFKVVVRLTPRDVYEMEFWKKGTTAPTDVVKDIYCNQLQETFTAQTGLYTRL